MLTPGGVGGEDIVVQYRSIIEASDKSGRDFRADGGWQIVFKQRYFDLGSET